MSHKLYPQAWRISWGLYGIAGYRMAAHLSVWASWIAQRLTPEAVRVERGLGGSEPRPALTVRPRFAT